MKYDEIKNLITLKTFPAKIDEWVNVSAYLEEVLEKEGVATPSIIQITIVLEELFVNIAHYAYVGTGHDEEGEMQLGTAVKDGAVYLVFIDKGIPFDPLAKKDPDLDTSLEEKPIGGLGIYMAKKWASDIAYERINDQNILMFKKKL
ncbi:MAG: ATP-binding protein [Lachnospiraceae bacterium]|nr:ATP-binding protein [Lachnospiraceae bacterium]